jgi:hypothetical protein
VHQELSPSAGAIVGGLMAMELGQTLHLVRPAQDISRTEELVELNGWW